MKWHTPLLALAVFPVHCLGESGPQISTQLELKTVLQIAREHNPQLKASKSEIAVARAERSEASRRPNPAFSLNAENYRLFRTNPGAFFQTQEITARIDQEVETGGKRRLRTQGAELKIHAQEANYEDTARRLRLQVTAAYLKGVLAQTNLGASEAVLEGVDQIIQLNRIRLENGDISRMELRRLEVERLRFVDDVFHFRLALANAKSTLLTRLGAPFLTATFHFSDTLPFTAEVLPTQEGILLPSDLAELERQAMAQRPDLMAAIYQERWLDTETNRQRAIRSPNITVGAGYKRDLAENAVVFGLTIPLQIFNRNKGGIARALAERERAKSLAAQARNLILLEVRKAFNAVEVNRERLGYIEKESLEKAKQSREIVREAYRLGGTDLINLLDAERAYQETLKTYNQARFDYRMSLYELAGAVGLEAN